MPQYQTIMADPPWRYRKDGVDRRGDRSYGSGVLRWAEQHYQTMSNEQIRDLPVQAMAAPNAHLYLWTTSPRLFGERNDLSINPADIAKAWGFDYVTTLVWHKTGAPGMGNYFRVDQEFVLFCVRGHAPIPPSKRLSTVFAAPRSAHSAKPDVFYAMAENVSKGPRLEMFARSRREGWDSWGDEVPEHMQHRIWVPGDEPIDPDVDCCPACDHPLAIHWRAMSAEPLVLCDRCDCTTCPLEAVA